MESRDVGLIVAGAGVLLVLIGLGMAAGVFSWFGRLPGDMRIEGENVRVYIPIASMLLISVALSLVFALLRRLF